MPVAVSILTDDSASSCSSTLIPIFAMIANMPTERQMTDMRDIHAYVYSFFQNL